MNDDRLLSALRRLGEQELPLATDRTIRGRLETSWTARSRGPATSGSGIRRLMPLLGAFVLTAGIGGSALGASADSPLWDTRLALESAGEYLRISADDRVAYLRDLARSRTEEAARQEVLGNAGAAAKARAAASSVVVQLGGEDPHVQVVLPAAPSTQATGTPTPTSSPPPSPAPSSSATPVPASSSPARTVTPTPVRTNSPVVSEPVHTPTPTPVESTSAKPSITIAGTVRDSAGVAVSGACITTSSTTPTSTAACVAKTTNGSYAFTASVASGETITLYAHLTSPTGTVAGSATAQATAPNTVMPAITLTPRK